MSQFLQKSEEVNFFTDQVRRALGSGGCSFVCHHAQKSENCPISDLFNLTPKYFLPLLHLLTWYSLLLTQYHQVPIRLFDDWCCIQWILFMILFIKNHIIWFPSVQHCNWFGFRISLSLSWEGAIFRDEIENYFSYSRLARRDPDYHMTILVIRDENEITYIVILMFQDEIETLENHFSWSSEKKWSWLLSRIPGIEKSRWPLISTSKNHPRSGI